MSIVGTLAMHSFREILGTRVMYSVIAFAAVVMIFAILASQWTIGEEVRFVSDIGIGAMLALGIVIVITRGAVTLSREIERKTVLVVLARPIKRWQFVVGNFLGLALILLLLVASLFIVLSLILLPLGGMPGVSLLAAAWGVYLELLMVSAVAILTSNLSSPILAIILTLLVFMGGHMASTLFEWTSVGFDVHDSHLTPSMRRITEMYQTGPAHWFLRISYYLLPNMGHVNYKMYAANNLPIHTMRVLIGSVYSVVYSAIAVWLAVAVFSRRDMR